MTHIIEHPEMVGLENAIRETLAEPEYVVQSIVDKQVQLYYHLYRDTRVGDKFLCVVVKTHEKDAFVITA